jgi:hypothetical protein
VFQSVSNDANFQMRTCKTHAEDLRVAFHKTLKRFLRDAINRSKPKV